VDGANRADLTASRITRARRDPRSRENRPSELQRGLDIVQEMSGWTDPKRTIAINEVLAEHTRKDVA
jgi:hypothetical protein